MFSKHSRASLLVAIVVSLWLAVPPAVAQTPKTIQIDGSSTVYPITKAVLEAYEAKSGKQGIAVAFSGTGGGFKKFCKGETDINDASRPISLKEMQVCREANIAFMELPIGFDALTVVVNPKNTWAKEMTVAELKKI
jgi:phosphate transport system substrate-binding protein